MEKTEKREEEDVNPFSALFGFKKKSKKGKEEKKEDKVKAKLEIMKKKGVSKDSHVESLVRKLGELRASDSCFSIFDIYKKAHGMASHPEPAFEEIREK